ncbi:hypothetical protein LSO9J_50064 [Candidatus Liberibacter solanacearum]
MTSKTQDQALHKKANAKNIHSSKIILKIKKICLDIPTNKS